MILRALSLSALFAFAAGSLGCTASTDVDLEEDDDVEAEGLVCNQAELAKCKRFGGGNACTSKWCKQSSSSNTSASGVGAKIIAQASTWIGKDFRPGQKAQCANFAREILMKACSSRFSSLSASRPWDYDAVRQYAGGSFSPAFADSLAGSEIGTRVSKDALQPGDLVFWADTYSDGWPYGKGIITHVGFYAGGGMVIDRSTSSMPVRKRAIGSPGGYVVGGIRVNPALCNR
jgi:hypothetical protein